MDKIKELLKNRKVRIGLYGLAGFIIVLAFIMLILNYNKITKLEKVKIEEKSAEISDYFNEITENKDDKGNYINFAVEYLYNTKDKEKYTIDEIKDVINSNFDLEYTDKTIGDIGISQAMQGKGIVFDNATGTFKYSYSRTITDIANDKIYYFKINKIKKINKNKFKVVYDKYVVSNPYEILNYYNDYNIEHYDKIDEQFDTSKIVNYLKGKEKVGAIKKIIREEDNKKFGSVEGKTTVVYVIKDKKLLIEKIS